MATPPLNPLKPSRIAIVNERWTAGATRAAKDLLRGLQSRHHVAYFPNGPQLSASQQLDALAHFSGIQPSALCAGACVASPSSPALALTSADLRWCPACMNEGFHAALFQFLPISRCP